MNPYTSPYPQAGSIPSLMDSDLERSKALPLNGTAPRRAKAVRCVRMACEMLAARGIKVKVIGSLAKGDFGPYSDVDLLILECPRSLKYSIEGDVEDCLEGLPFDVIYEDEIPDYKREHFLKGAVDASDLR